MGSFRQKGQPISRMLLVMAGEGQGAFRGACPETQMALSSKSRQVCRDYVQYRSAIGLLSSRPQLCFSRNDKPGRPICAMANPSDEYETHHVASIR